MIQTLVSSVQRLGQAEVKVHLRFALVVFRSRCTPLISVNDPFPDAQNFALLEVCAPRLTTSAT